MLPSPLTHARKFLFSSLRSSRSQVGITPCQHSCTPCSPPLELCRHPWQCHHPRGCVTAGVSGSAHGPTSGRHGYLMGSRFCALGVFLSWISRGWGVSGGVRFFCLLCLVFFLFVFVFRTYQYLFSISSKLLASPPLSSPFQSASRGNKPKKNDR